MICLQFSHLYFTDIIDFKLQLQVLPTANGNNSPALTVATTETLYNIIYRSGHSNSSGSIFQTWLASFNYTVNATYQPCMYKQPKYFFTNLQILVAFSWYDSV